MNDVTIGTCSICGGPVVVPGVWHGVIPPLPTCASCGAVKKGGYGPKVDMEPFRTETRKDTG